MVTRFNQFMTWLCSTGPGNLAMIVMFISIATVPVILKAILLGQLSIWTFSSLFAIIAVVCVFMLMQFGGPRNWWYPFFGTLMIVNIAKIVQNPEMRTRALELEVFEWVEAMSSGPYYQVNAFKYKFLYKRDAAAFKLAWM